MNQNDIFKNEYRRLNPAQKEAVESLYGPVMVVAGPGTGKTQIIGLRTANIILKAGVDPSNILITTFTEAGVIAIRKRLVYFLGNEAYKVNVSTVHSLSQDIIKTFPEKFLEYKAGTPIDEVESLEILKEIIDSCVEKKMIEHLTTSYDKYFYLRDIKFRIGNLKGEGINVAQLDKLILSQIEVYNEELSEIKPTLKKYETTRLKQETHINKLRELGILFHEYNLALRNLSKYDFNDMINFVLEKLDSDNDLKQHYAEKFQFIMLDEYQDTNNAQNMIINSILSISDEKPNIMVVGDDDQSIYRFQGANIENMLDFSTHYTDTKFVVLENNYRSTQSILDLSSALIENNEERLSKKIESINKKLIASSDLKNSTTKPSLLRASSDLDEKKYIINSIQQDIKNGVSALDIAIIVRGNKEVQEWTNILQQNNLEAESKLKTDILKSNYVEFIGNYLTLIDNPYFNENALIDIMRSDIVGLSQVDVLKINRALYISNYSKKIKGTMIDFLIDDLKMQELELNNLNAIISFRNQLFSFGSQLSQVSFIEFFHIFIEQTGILQYVEKYGTFEDLEDIYTFFNKIKDWSLADKKLNIHKLYQKIDLYKSYNFPISRQILKKIDEGVQVLTAHSSKGLEFHTVYIPGLYTGNWEGKRVVDKLKLPSGIAGDGLQESQFNQVEEDRRLFFVAATRAREQLHLSFPAGIGTKPLLQSVFIEEINGYYEEVQNNFSHDINQVIINNLKNNLVSYDELEFHYISQFLESYKLSPSDLNTFLEDPLMFLQRVVFKYPFIDNKYTIFGKVYHRALELFYLQYKSEQKLPSKEHLTTTFKILLNKEILNPEEYEEALEKGIVGLQGYYDLYSSTFNEPLLLEYSLRRKNIIFEGVPLTGTIDKIEKINITPSISPLIGDGNHIRQSTLFKDTVALIDYKTGKSKSLGMIKGLDRYGNKKEGEGKYFRQLLFYKLLCECDPEFTSQYDIGSLAIDFVEGKDGIYKYVDVEYSNEEFDHFKTELTNAWSQINDINFWKDLLNK